MLVMPSGIPVLLVNVAVRGVLVIPTVWLPKLRLGGNISGPLRNLATKASSSLSQPPHTDWNAPGATGKSEEKV